MSRLRHDCYQSSEGCRWGGCRRWLGVCRREEDLVRACLVELAGRELALLLYLESFSSLIAGESIDHEGMCCFELTDGLG